MQQPNDPINHCQQTAIIPEPIADSAPTKSSRSTQCRTRHGLTPKQIINDLDICSRFDKISGQGLPKRMSTGKFVHLGPTVDLPDKPL